MDAKPRRFGRIIGRAPRVGAKAKPKRLRRANLIFLIGGVAFQDSASPWINGPN
jgi:hypothetical protein